MAQGRTGPGCRACGPGLDCPRAGVDRAGLRRAALGRMRRCPGAGGGGRVSRAVRGVAAPFLAAVPAGVRVRARLRVSTRDAEVLATVGRHLGSLAGRDLAARCAEGRLDVQGRAVSRAVRKRALTAKSSSRRGDHPGQRGRLPDRFAEPGRRAAHSASTGPGDHRAAGGPGGEEAGAAGRVRDPGRAARQDDPAQGAAGAPDPGREMDRGGGGPGDAGWPEADARPAEPGRRRSDRGSVAGAVGRHPVVPDRRRGAGRPLGQLHNRVEPRPGLAGGQPPGPARLPGERAARPLPADMSGPVRLPRR